MTHGDPEPPVKVYIVGRLVIGPLPLVHTVAWLDCLDGIAAAIRKAEYDKCLLTAITQLVTAP